MRKFTSPNSQMRIVWIMLWSMPLAAATPICVRNYGDVACQQLPQGYGYVLPLDPNSSNKICARLYDAFYCTEASKDYEEVATVSGEAACVLNDNQPPVANLCESTPDDFAYIRAQP